MSENSYSNLIPSYEHERLQALQPYRVLGTPGQGLFNDLVGVTAKLLDMPIALVSLVREEDVLFIGNHGLDGADFVNREDSLCSVAILQNGTTVFENLEAEPCNLVNPFLARKLQLLFYAGEALRTPAGLALGTLCVIDRQPRQFSPEESALLTKLATVAEDLLQLQMALANDPSLARSLRSRIDASLEQSFTRLETLAQLRAWETSPDTPAAHEYRKSHFDEASYLAVALHRELQAVLAVTRRG